jgi:hypothetical protein
MPRLSLPVCACGLLALVHLAACQLQAQSALWGPVVGYVLAAESQSIRPLNGIPGASTLGSPVKLPFAVVRAAFDAHTDAALVVSGEDGSPVYWIRGLGASSPVILQLADAAPGADRIVLNESGTAALLYSISQSGFQIVDHLNDSPRVSPLVSFGNQGAVSALALNPDAQLALVGVTGPSGGQVLAVHMDGSDQGVYRSLLQVTEPSAIRFLRDGADAAIADHAENRIYLLQDAANTAVPSSVADVRDGIMNPVDLAAAGPGQDLLVANAGGSNILSLDLGFNRSPLIAPTPVPPTKLQPMSGGMVFAVSEVGPAPLTILDISNGLNVLFVPLD